MAAQCAAEGTHHPDYLLRLAELELIDRHQRMVQRRIRAARFPAVKTLCNRLLGRRGFSCGGQLSCVGGQMLVILSIMSALSAE